MPVAVEIVLLAVDHGHDADRVATALGACGFRVRKVTKLAEAEHLLHGGKGQALVAAARLLDEDVVSRLRRDLPGQPLIPWLSPASSERAADLLSAGVDDVLDERMGDRELGARVAAAVRQHVRPDSKTVYGPLEIDAETGEVRWEGVELRLTRRERQVLHALASAAGRTVRRDRLYRQVWGYAMARGDRSVDVNVTRLRAKLADAAAGGIEISTQPGVGYRLELREGVRDATSLVTAL
ncbi:MAG: response regulator transcription factor [Actinomycetota bacterium]|nr:response regulator transcription factor [Actinomycetota bacterium]